MTRKAQTATGERMYTIAEVAALWGYSRDTIERLLRTGELEFVKLGERRRRIRASVIEAYVEAHRVDA